MALAFGFPTQLLADRLAHTNTVMLVGYWDFPLCSDSPSELATADAGVPKARVGFEPTDTRSAGGGVRPDSATVPICIMFLFLYILPNTPVPYWTGWFGKTERMRFELTSPCGRQDSTLYSSPVLFATPLGWLYTYTDYTYTEAILC